MAQDQSQYLRWVIPSHRKPERGRTWYIIAGLIVLICCFFSFFTFSAWRIVFLGLNSNFLFILIIILSLIIMIINDSQPTEMLNVELGPEGFRLAAHFYSYDEIKNFAVIYKPKQSVKQLYFESKASLRPRISIPLRNMDALTVRNFLVRYLDEDLERDNIPLSEQLTKVLKL